MADENAGRVEYGRLAFIGPQPGSVEYGRLPSVGSFYYTLTVESSGAAAVSIDVSPADVDGNSDGTTDFERIYAKNTSVTLTAPAVAGYSFDHWELDGEAQGGDNVLVVTMDEDHAVIVYYVAAPVTETPILGIEMLKVYLPKYKYWTSVYPNLESGAEGRPIPERWGDLHNVTPICIDTTTGKYKVANASASRKIKAIDAVYADDKTLTVTDDYTVDLTNGEFTIETTPVLQANTTYYIVFESDITINGTDYLAFAQNLDGAYADGTMFYIDGSNNWSDQSKDLYFKVLVRDSIGGDEYALVDYYSQSEIGAWTGNWNWGCELRKAAASTKIAQSFKTPATGGPWYLSRVFVDISAAGAPSASRTTKAYIISSYGPEVRIGAKSYRIEDYEAQGGGAPFPQRGESSEVRCDMRGYCKSDGTTLIDTLADWMSDVYVNLLGGSASALNATDLTALAAARTQEIALDLSEEKQFQEILQVAEAGQLWKLLPSLAGDYALRYYASGEPAGTPHLFNEHISNFKMKRIWKNVFQTVKVKYDKDPTTGDWKIAEETSDVAQYVYNNQETLEVETMLKDAADGTQLAEDYLGTDAGSSSRQYYECPTRLAEFDVCAGYGFNLIPSQKVKLTLTRADYAGGSMSGVLFRILKVSKGTPLGGSHVEAVLDSMTY